MVYGFMILKKFSVVSISGSSCSLSCTYCASTYIKSMEGAMSPEEFYKLIKKRYEQGTHGFLISGGFSPRGELLNLRRVLPEMKKLKKELPGLIFNIHPGLLDKDLIEELSDVVDIVDYEFAYSRRAFESKGLKDRSKEDYVNTLEYLLENVRYVVPHIMLGFPDDDVEESIKLVSSMKPYLLNFLVLIPTKGTPSEKVELPSVNEILKLVELGNKLMNGKVSIGCMRPHRIKEELDKAAVERGLVERIANPSRKVKVEMYDACCSLPEKYFKDFKM